MGRYYTEYTNRRGKTYGAQILPGDGVHTRGWDAGVRVTPHPAGELGKVDSFAVYMTWGSHDSGTAVMVGTVYDTANGPVFVPAQMPRERRSLRIPRKLRAIRAEYPRRERGRRVSAGNAGRIAELTEQRDYGNDYGPAEAAELAGLTGSPVQLPGAGSHDRIDETVFGPQPGDYGYRE